MVPNFGRNNANMFDAHSPRTTVSTPRSYDETCPSSLDFLRTPPKRKSISVVKLASAIAACDDLYPISNLHDLTQSYDLEDSQEVLSNVELSPGHTLPQATGCRKHRRMSYRIRFATTISGNHDAKNCSNQGISVPSNKTIDYNERCIRGVRGIDRPNVWVSWNDSGTEDGNSVDEGYCTDVSDNRAHSATSNKKLESKYQTRPDVLVTPIKSMDGSRKWIAKRLWDIEDKDDEELEYEIDHFCLMHGVRVLMGIPGEMGMTSDDWQVNIDESDPWEMTVNKDSAPALPTRTRDDRYAVLFKQDR